MCLPRFARHATELKQVCVAPEGVDRDVRSPMRGVPDRRGMSACWRASSVMLAPSERAKSSFSSDDVNGNYSGADARAIMIAESPTPPQPCTATHWPSVTRAWSTTARKDVANRQPRLAAVSKLNSSGRATRLRSARWIATYSAKLPQWVKPGWNW